MIDPTIRKVNKLFILLIKNDDNDPTRNSSADYYLCLIEIKYFNAVINSKPFFDQPIKNKLEAYKKFFKCQKIEIKQ